MKKIFLGLMISVFPLVLFAATAQPSQVSQSKQKDLTLNTNLIKQIILYQKNIIQMQSNLLKEQKQQIVLLQRLLSKANEQTNKNFKWVTMAANSMAIPANRINAGLTGETDVYICHAKFRNLGVHPGTLTPKGCLVSYGGVAYIEKAYQVLTGTGTISWKSPNALMQWINPPMPFDGLGPIISRDLPNENVQTAPSDTVPIIGGHEKGHALYVCRTIVNNEMHVGKVVSGNCNVGFQGRELRQPQYQVLFGK